MSASCSPPALDGVTPDGGCLAAALAAGTVLLDGGLATAMEAAGHDVTGSLWSARLLRDSPGAVIDVHRAYARAGARVLETASYQATFEGLGDDAPLLWRRSVALARQAAAGVDGPRWVAGSVGPYGAMLADGSEYTGAYGEALDVARLRAWHRPRLEILAEAGADVLACETVPALAEVEALVAEVQALGVPAWIALTTVTGADGVVRTRLGEPAAEAFAMVAGVPEIVAVGVNCTAPDGVLPAVRAAVASGKPVVVYPNSGETWDGVARRWVGSPDVAASDVTAWIVAGARLVGGCCRMGPAAISALAGRVMRSG